MHQILQNPMFQPLHPRRAVQELERACDLGRVKAKGAILLAESVAKTALHDETRRLGVLDGAQGGFEEVAVGGGDLMGSRSREGHLGVVFALMGEWGG